MKVSRDAELPAFSNALKRFGEQVWSSICRVPISAVMDKNGSRLAVAQRNARLKKVRRVAVNAGKMRITLLCRIQNDERGADTKRRF
jgi:hypothetical protein